MNFLLTADLHLTSNPIEEYRWTIFNFLAETALKYKINRIYIAGDFVNTKDRHSGKLVNRIVESLHTLEKVCLVYILAGNHDAPLEGIYYWKFLNKYKNIFYITEPLNQDDIWLLPFSSNPIRDWTNLNFNNAEAIFMHQPVQGAFIDEYRKLEKAPILPKLPKVPIFSGDIHNPQIVPLPDNEIIYVGVPHPVHFNENWKNRIILIENEDYKNYKEIYQPTIIRQILQIKSAAELQTLQYKIGDQLRVRCRLNGSNLSNWPIEEQLIREWAKEKGIYLASVEPSIEGDVINREKVKAFELLPPEQVLTQYAKQEKLSDDVLKMGIEILNECI